MKQSTAPVDGFDYSQVAQLNRTLEELFITGSPTLSDAFKHLTKLHTISLGMLSTNFSDYVMWIIQNTWQQDKYTSYLMADRLKLKSARLRLKGLKAHYQ